MKKILDLIFVLYFVTLGESSQPCVINDVCEQDGLPGVYSLDKDCPHFLKLDLKNRYGHGWCNFSGKNAVICCIGASPVVNEKRPKYVFNRMAEVCEKLGVNEYTPAVDRIFGGLQSFPGQFPHFAALAYNRSEVITFACGGTLISSTHVLTAAHCVLNSSKPSFVRLGMTNLHDKHNDGHIDINIRKIIKHPEYRTSSKYNDIALIELEKEVESGPFIWPACLNSDDILQANKNLIITGFGRTDDKNGFATSDHLLHATVKEVPLDQCQEIFGKVFKNRMISSFAQGVTETLICARNQDSRADTCQGDSGSALLAKDDGKFYVVGITSFGVFCGSPYPAFYTRVSKYIDWIEKVMKGAAVTS